MAGWFRNLFSSVLSKSGELVGYYVPVSGSEGTLTGLAVSDETALKVSTYFAALRTVSSDIASMPLFLYRRMEDGGRQKATDHQLYRVLTRRPVYYMDSYQWKEFLVLHLLHSGNIFIQVIRDRSGSVVELNPINPSRMVVKVDNDRLIYAITGDDGKPRVLRDVVHIRYMSKDGIMGIGIFDKIRETLGISTAIEQVQAYKFKYHSTPTGMIIVPRGLLKNEEEFKFFQEKWNEIRAGVQNQGKIGYLKDGMDFKETNISPVDLQLLELKKLNCDDIARFFGVPPTRLNINYANTSSYNNTEAQNRQYYDSCIRPILSRIETALETIILSPSEQDEFFIEFNANELLRADSQTRFQNYATGIMNGIYSLNQVAGFENLPSLGPIGDFRFVPGNLMLLEQAVYGADVWGNKDVEEEIEEPPKMAPPSETTEEEESRSEVRDIEVRWERALDERQRIRKAWKAVFLDAFTRLIKREVSDLKKIIEKEFKPLYVPAVGGIGEVKEAGGQVTIQGRSRLSLALALGKYYERVKNPEMASVGGVFWEYAKKILQNPYEGYVQALCEATAREVSATAAVIDVQAYAERYVKRLVARHSGLSQKILIDVADQGKDALLMTVDEWLRTRAQREALAEEKDISERAIFAQYKKAGVKAIEWKTVGDTCPICRKLEGKVISLDQYFVNENETLADGGSGVVMKSTYKKKHPPLHRGCDCTHRAKG